MYEKVIKGMKKQGVEFAMGLSNKEIYRAEQKYGIVFPDGLKAFYKEALPISKGFYNWRDYQDENVENIKKNMKTPVEGVLKDVEEIEWCEEWGKEPNSLEERKRRIEDMAMNAPKLIPVYSHRYMASFECKKPPIFSICGTDIIYYARNVMEYFLIEFKLKEYKVFMNDEVSSIPFWSDLL